MPMAESERTEGYLRLILDRVDGWLRFAEVKNAGVIALSGTVTTALLAALRDLGDLSELGRPLLALAAVLFLVAMAVGVYSYLPQLRPSRKGTDGTNRPSEEDNLFYYGDIAKYDAAALVEAVAERFAAVPSPPKAASSKVVPSSGSAPPGQAALHLAGQATVNAQITLRKMRLFDRAARLVLLGALAYAAALVMPRGAPAVRPGAAPSMGPVTAPPDATLAP